MAGARLLAESGDRARPAPDAVRARVRELADIAPAAFSEAADDPAIVALRRPLVAQLVDRIADRARRCASVVAT